MAVNMYQIKRWYLMLTGKSIWHVNQDIGKYFDKDKISGYYNNMTEKVTQIPELLNSEDLPKLNLSDGKSTYFPVAIFQYGLGAYDLYIKSGEEIYAQKFMQCVSWTLEHQDAQGRWNNFAHYSPQAPYGAMAQGEGASLLIRAYKHIGDTKYLNAAKRAIDFMLLPLEDGGTTKYEGDGVYLMEYTFKEMVLNGGIFAWWGLYDYVLVTQDKGKYAQSLEQTLNTIVKVLPLFKNSYWSLYSLDGLITSPFYHNLHIAQMQAMYVLTEKPIFKEYALRWERQQHNLLFKSMAFVKKSIQKILE